MAASVEDVVSQKLVVVTGASSGIGLACVKAYAEQGHPLLMLARNVEKMEAGKAAIVKELSAATKEDSKKLSGRIFLKKCDVSIEAENKETKTHSIGSAIAECLAENSGSKLYVDCLINNAGVMLVLPFEFQDLTAMKTMMNVNVLGVINGLKAVTSDMKSRKAGTIINVSSIAGKKVFDSAAVYCATKFAVQALTEGLRKELAGSNVKVSVVCPGIVDTNLLEGNADMVKDAVSKSVKAMSLGALQAEDVANACYFIYNQPPRSCIRELQIAPVNQQM